nr:zinc finger, CCHC-type [Tanacetum cinerariifolium]
MTNIVANLQRGVLICDDKDEKSPILLLTWEEDCPYATTFFEIPMMGSDSICRSSARGSRNVKDITTNFRKLDKFKGHDFRRWQKKMHFLLTTLKVVYVLTTPMPKLLEDPTVEAIRIREKWENDDYICRGHILIGMFDSLFDVYTNIESAKELWDSLESKYTTEDSSSKKFLVSNFNNYKMVDSRPVMEQYNV